jgi:AraC family transcriptional regulator
LRPRIVTLPEKKLIGMHMSMSYAHNRTGELWKNFMPRRNEIRHRLNTLFYSLQVYDKAFDFTSFSPDTPFEKWALAEVSDLETIPTGMKSFVLSAGKYAVFIHRGPASEYHTTFQFIFGTWLPSSGFIIDQRPHFEILTENYRPDDPDAEEEIWIPVRTLSLKQK